MTATIHMLHARGHLSGMAPADETEATPSNLASDLEIRQLQDQVNTMNAKAQQIDNEIAQMLADTGGAANSSPELEHARAQSRDIRSTADAVRSVLSNAPTDPKSGKKMIAAKTVAGLSISIGGCITSGEKERGAVHEATAHVEAREEARHAKAAVKIQDAPKKSTVAHGRCMPVSVVSCTPEYAERAHHWVSGSITHVADLGARISTGAAGYWHGFTASAASAYETVASSDPVGAVTRMASRAKTGISSGYDVVATHVSHGYEAAKESAATMATVASEKLHAAKAMVASAFARLNPFSSNDAPVEVAKEQVEETQPSASSAMEKALAQAKMMLKHSLVEIRLPEISGFMPGSVRNPQGVTGGMAWAA